MKTLTMIRLPARLQDTIIPKTTPMTQITSNNKAIASRVAQGTHRFSIGLRSAVFASGLAVVIGAMGVAAAAELTIADGVVVKFGPDAQLVVRDKITVGKNTIFTSQKDDAAAGQSGAAPQVPAAGDWRGIRIEKSALPYAPQLGEGTIVRYAGGQDGAGLTLRGVKPALNFLQFTDNVVGLRLLQGASPQGTGLSFARNGIGLEANENAAPVIGNSQFTQNTTNAVLNKTPTTVIQATGNWWGHSTGPKDSVGNPQGQGDAVSAGVNYGQFLAQAPLLNPSIQLVNPAPYIEQSTVAVKIACVNAVEYRIAENGAFTGVAYQSLTNGQAMVNVPLSSGDGRKQLTVQFRSASGAVTSAILNGGVLVDTLQPQLAITNPAEGSVISKSITVEATASDTAGISRVEFYLNDALQKTVTTSPYTYSWNTDAIADGEYVFRVAAIDGVGKKTEQIRNVTFSREVLPPDTVGPIATNLKFDAVLISDGSTLTRTGTVAVDVSDRSGVARVDLLLDGVIVATMNGQSGTYQTTLNLDNVANGSHTLLVRTTDSLNNVSETSRNITVTHALPDAPQISQPVNGTTTRTKEQTVVGKAKAGNQVQVYVNSIAVGSPLTIGSDGNFTVPITLASGLNQIQATATDQHGTSPLSTAVSITLDTNVPVAPSNLIATAQVGGKIRLSWTRSSDPNATSVAIYRASSPFTAISEAIKINSSPAATTTYDDLPTQDGIYYYRLVSVNNAGTTSDPTNQVQVASDSKPPRASIAYTPLGKVDTATGRIGQGKVNVALTVTEPLQITPYFAVVPNGSAPITIELIKQDDTHYNGSFTIDATSGSGTANVLFSARDMVGNRGTDVDVGATLKIDTEGPAVTAIAINPIAPIKNDAAQTITATFTLSKAMKSGETPQLSYLLSGPVRSPAGLTGITQINATTWRGSFVLPSDAGAGTPENFSFIFRGIDDLDNVSTKIATPGNLFQVYQGNLPPFATPLGLKAEAKPGGKVRLTWQAVEQAAAYQIYRQGPGETTLQPTQRATGIEYIDTTTQDGKYYYAVASVRQSNEQEAISSQSAPVEVTTSSSAPGAPQNLTLKLVSTGIQATWQPPLNSTVASYNLYRSSASTISTIEGLTPIRTGIKQAGTVDANPSPTDHAYVVTALDAAGNESAISNSVYLNFDLLPVATLKVEQIGNDLPQLSWTPTKSANAGYNVYIGPDASKVKLTATPTTSLSFQDSGYTTGERRYTVAATDSNGVEQPRAITLPNVNVQVVSGMPIKRGVMNKLQVQVTNTSSEGFANAQVVVRIANVNHKSEIFSLGGNETRMLPVIVGGYAELQANAPMQVGIEIVPNEGELVRIVRNTTAEISDAALVVGMATEEFTRGGTGKLRLTIENTTEVDVELLTARSNGNLESDELRFKILDADGNVLATQPYKQVFGASVITVGTGQTVARVAAGASYTSDVFSLNVPQIAPDKIRVKLEVDKIRYHTGQPDEVVIKGTGSEKQVVLADTAYSGEVTDASPISSFGDQDVIITGRAIDRKTSAALPNAKLKLILNQQGFERVINVLTDASGSFIYAFKPTITDSGLYKVSAVHPDITDRPEQRAFTINRVTVGPSPVNLNVPRNYNYSIPLQATSGTGTAATNLRLVLDPTAQPTGALPAGVTVQLPSPINIGSRQTLNLPVRFTADNTAQPSGRFILSAFSDEHANSPIGLVTVNYTLSEAKPYLTSSPSFVETGLAQGSSVVESIVLENKGLQEALNVQLTLTNKDGSAAPSWASIATNAVLGTIAIGEKKSIDLSFTPSSSVAEGVYEFKLNVQGTNVPAQSMSVFASITQSGIGNVLFKASDIYTATVGKDGKLILGLAGATVTIQNEDVASVTYSLTTDALGEALFQNIPSGRYKFRAKANNHQELGGRFEIKPGITANQPIFLDYNLVQVEWSVREVTIQDRYDINLTATFETDVPAPVVVLNPTSTNIPLLKAGEVFQGELTLTNYGLVRADNVKALLPKSDINFRYEFLTEPPATLEAKQKVTLLYRIIALVPLDATSGTASGGGCWSYSNQLVTTYDYTCANGTLAQGNARSYWFSYASNTCGGASGPPTGANISIPGSGGTGGIGGTSPGYSTLEGLDGCNKSSDSCYKKNTGGGGAGEGNTN